MDDADEASGAREKSKIPATCPEPLSQAPLGECAPSHQPRLGRGGGGDPQTAGVKVFLPSDHTKQGKSGKYGRICRISPCTRALAEAIASALLCTAQLAGRGDSARGHAREGTRRASPAPRAFARLSWGQQQSTYAGHRCSRSPALLLAAAGTIAASAKQPSR